MHTKIIGMFREFRDKVREINRKYKKPRITMTPAVKFALLCLRLYLIALLLILAYKFFTLVK